MNNGCMNALKTQFFSFQPEILLDGCEDFHALLQSFLCRYPEALYYYSSCSWSCSGNRCTVHMNYEHTDFPVGQVRLLDTEGLKRYLPTAVSSGQKKVVTVLPKNVNFDWIMKCFWKQSSYFFPHLDGYTGMRWHMEEIPYTVHELRFRYRIGTVKLREMEMRVNNEIQALQKRLFPIPMPDSAKCYIAHNYLADTVRYCKADRGQVLEKRYAQSAYGALIRKQCVCQGYAEAYKRILNGAGIPCDLVCGEILDDEGGMHAWNIVHLQGNRIHSHVDVTWDASPGSAVKKHFLKGDSFYSEKRDWDRFYFTACTDGGSLLKEARQFCRAHEAELIQSGLRPAWIQ